MDFNAFERLNGVRLGLFVGNVIKGHEIDESILNYYRLHARDMDPPHLEMILLLLGKLGTREALREVAAMLDHSTNYVKYQAIQVIGSAPAIDEHTMKKIIEILSDPRHAEYAEELRPALHRGDGESARLLAEDFLNHQ